MLEAARQYFREQQYVAELPIVDIGEFLRHDRRRVLVDVLAAADGQLSADELAETITTTELETPPAELDQDDHVRDVYVSLVHVHLPKLAEMGVVEFDSDDEVVEQGPAFDHTQRVLEVVRGETDGTGGDD
ncbi:DUF7344 domain-containing protein [Natronobacterium gregoryi]|uniref:DUF7344 domain-containing protein n=2 Tax=Natronobacterium gregoryi TaxID=44930 RepID=L0AI07_NATGS|nr:hypothetical protein [Natronobacterium gregoryi]AFZ73074.1 hypothetical protein Natgr_1889 [Natronobacterium gregoryi SP2]ELY70825.1 hypothetical protein C490_06027 [Natronobacterium gregoryi SP2]PLK20405.1 hypothetical protein CYV19_09770 [Natronobacterium gregoryi SP2]SFI61903.1 hypothetical protein SAMN05443661_102192 [Natronobacterium gregoryi]